MTKNNFEKLLIQHYENGDIIHDGRFDCIEKLRCHKCKFECTSDGNTFCGLNYYQDIIDLKKMKTIYPELFI